MRIPNCPARGSAMVRLAAPLMLFLCLAAAGGAALSWTPQPVEALLAAADVVVMGKVTVAAAGSRQAAVRPLAVYRGAVSPYLDLAVVPPAGGDPACPGHPATFRRGELAMVFLDRRPGSPFYYPVCGAQGKFTHLGDEGDWNGYLLVSHERFDELLDPDPRAPERDAADERWLTGEFIGLALRLNAGLGILGLGLGLLVRGLFYPLALAFAWLWLVPLLPLVPGFVLEAVYLAAQPLAVPTAAALRLLGAPAAAAELGWLWSPGLLLAALAFLGRRLAGRARRR